MTSKAYERGAAAGHARGCGTTSAADWAAHMSSSSEAEHDWIAEMADFGRGFESGVAAWKAEHPYAVLGFGSHPDDGNDDCYMGQDFAALAEARAAYLGAHEPAVAFIMLDGPDVNEIRRNPAYRAPRRDHDEWRAEHAMQMGMGLGIDAYNDAMEGT